MTNLQAYTKIDHTCCLNSSSERMKYGIIKNDPDTPEEQKVGDDVDCENIIDMVNCLDTLHDSVQCLQLIINKTVDMDQLVSLCSSKNIRTACFIYNTDKYISRCLTIDEIKLIFRTYNQNKVDLED